MQSVPNKTDLLGDLDPGLPVCRLQSNLLITQDEENNNNDGFYLQCAYDVHELELKQSSDVGAVIISLTQRSTLRHREVKAQGYAAEVAQLDLTHSLALITR